LSVAWIKISDELEVYSTVDDMWDLFSYSTYFLSQFSIYYYILIGIAFFLIIGFGIAWKIGAIGRNFLRANNDR